MADTNLESIFGIQTNPITNQLINTSPQQAEQNQVLIDLNVQQGLIDPSNSIPTEIVYLTDQSGNYLTASGNPFDPSYNTVSGPVRIGVDLDNFAIFRETDKTLPILLNQEQTNKFAVTGSMLNKIETDYNALSADARLTQLLFDDLNFIAKISPENAQLYQKKKTNINNIPYDTTFNFANYIERLAEITLPQSGAGGVGETLLLRFKKIISNPAKYIPLYQAAFPIQPPLALDFNFLNNTKNGSSMFDADCFGKFGWLVNAYLWNFYANFGGLTFTNKSFSHTWGPNPTGNYNTVLTNLSSQIISNKSIIFNSYFLTFCTLNETISISLQNLVSNKATAFDNLVNINTLSSDMTNYNFNINILSKPLDDVVAQYWEGNISSTQPPMQGITGSVLQLSGNLISSSNDQESGEWLYGASLVIDASYNSIPVNYPITCDTFIAITNNTSNFVDTISTYYNTVSNSLKFIQFVEYTSIINSNSRTDAAGNVTTLTASGEYFYPRDLSGGDPSGLDPSNNLFYFNANKPHLLSRSTIINSGLTLDGTALKLDATYTIDSSNTTKLDIASYIIRKAYLAKSDNSIPVTRLVEFADANFILYYSAVNTGLNTNDFFTQLVALNSRGLGFYKQATNFNLTINIDFNTKYEFYNSFLTSGQFDPTKYFSLYNDTININPIYGNYSIVSDSNIPKLTVPALSDSNNLIGYILIKPIYDYLSSCISNKVFTVDISTTKGKNIKSLISNLTAAQIINLGDQAFITGSTNIFYYAGCTILNLFALNNPLFVKFFTGFPLLNIDNFYKKTLTYNDWDWFTLIVNDTSLNYLVYDCIIHPLILIQYLITVELEFDKIPQANKTLLITFIDNLLSKNDFLNSHGSDVALILTKILLSPNTIPDVISKTGIKTKLTVSGSILGASGYEENSVYYCPNLASSLLKSRAADLIISYLTSIRTYCDSLEIYFYNNNPNALSSKGMANNMTEQYFYYSLIKSDTIKKYNTIRLPYSNNSLAKNYIINAIPSLWRYIRQADFYYLMKQLTPINNFISNLLEIDIIGSKTQYDQITVTQSGSTKTKSTIRFIGRQQISATNASALPTDTPGITYTETFKASQSILDDNVRCFLFCDTTNYPDVSTSTSVTYNKNNYKLFWLNGTLFQPTTSELAGDYFNGNGWNIAYFIDGENVNNQAIQVSDTIIAPNQINCFNYAQLALMYYMYYVNTSPITVDKSSYLNINGLLDILVKNGSGYSSPLSVFLANNLTLKIQANPMMEQEKNQLFNYSAPGSFTNLTTASYNQLFNLTYRLNEIASTNNNQVNYVYDKFQNFYKQPFVLLPFYMSQPKFMLSIILSNILNYISESELSSAIQSQDMIVQMDIGNTMASNVPRAIKNVLSYQNVVTDPNGNQSFLNVTLSTLNSSNLLSTLSKYLQAVGNLTGDENNKPIPVLTPEKPNINVFPVTYNFNNLINLYNFTFPNGSDGTYPFQYFNNLTQNTNKLIDDNGNKNDNSYGRQISVSTFKSLFTPSGPADTNLLDLLYYNGKAPLAPTPPTPAPTPA